MGIVTSHYTINLINSLKKNYSEMLLCLNANAKPKKRSNLDLLLYLCTAWLDTMPDHLEIKKLIPAAQTLCVKRFWSNQQESLEWLLANGVRGLDVRVKDHRNANIMNKSIFECFGRGEPFDGNKCKFCNHKYSKNFTDPS